MHISNPPAFSISIAYESLFLSFITICLSPVSLYLKYFMNESALPKALVLWNKNCHCLGSSLFPSLLNVNNTLKHSYDVNRV